MEKLLMVLAFSFLTYTGMTQQLEPHKWKHRIILLFAETPESDYLQKQESLLESSNAGVEDRDLVTYRIFLEEGKAPGKESLDEKAVRQLRRRFDVPEKGFTFLLVGKDGTEKLRERKVVSIEQLFGLIDQMPMRRAEMRRRDN